MAENGLLQNTPILDSMFPFESSISEFVLLYPFDKTQGPK